MSLGLPCALAHATHQALTVKRLTIALEEANRRHALDEGRALRAGRGHDGDAPGLVQLQRLGHRARGRGPAVAAAQGRRGGAV